MANSTLNQGLTGQDCILEEQGATSIRLKLGLEQQAKVYCLWAGTGVSYGVFVVLRGLIGEGLINLKNKLKSETHGLLLS